MTVQEFRKHTAGWDRCDVCCVMKPLVLVYEMSIGILLDIMPDGRPTYVCFDCLKSPEHEYRELTER